MGVVGISGLTDAQIFSELQRGARFIVYQYCVSVLILTFRQHSDIYFVKSGESRIPNGLAYSLLSLVAGWWGIPWGPIYTIGSLITNFSGGKDVTSEILNNIRANMN